MDLGKLLTPERQADAPTLAAGTVLSIDWSTTTARVNVGGGEISAAMIGIPPIPGDAVQVLIAGGQAVILGIASRAASGIALEASANGKVHIKGDDGVEYTLPMGVGLSLSVGDLVLVDWSTGGVVSQEISGTVSAGISAPTPAAPIPKPPSGGTGATATRTRTFSPTQSGSKQNGSGWRGGIVYFGQSYSSAGFFYGRQIADTIPDGATLASIAIYLEVTASSGVSYLTIGMHDQGAIPAGDLILSDPINVGGARNGFRGWVDLSSGVFFDRLAKGLMLGISIKGPGYRRISGAPISGAIRITWKE